MKQLLGKLDNLSARQRLLAAIVLGFVAGIVWLLGMRFILQSNDSVHYHANFSVVIDGTPDEFKNFSFYEEVASCGGNDVNNPKLRVHLHDDGTLSRDNVVHVHDEAVTWGHLFANLGYTLGNDVIRTSQGVFVNGQDGKRLNFILNGEQVVAVANRVIGDQDILLVSYGKEDLPNLKTQYEQVPKDAGTYNNTADPAACSGEKPLTWRERLQRTLNLTK